MTRILGFTLLLASATLGLARAQADERTPQETVTDWVAAFNRNSPKALAAFYEPSDETEVIVSSGLRHRGITAIRRAYALDQERVVIFDSEAKGVRVRSFGQTALATFEHRFKVRFRQDDSRWQVHVRTTQVLRNVGGKWQIVHEHSSAIEGIDRVSPIEP